MSDFDYDCVIIGAGAAGLFCAMHAARRGRSVLVLEKSKKPGRKILMSGGGRCNFTNLDVRANNFLSANSHFCKSALSQYTQHDFIAWVESHSIAYHEKEAGQLFCDNKASDLLNALLQDCEKAGVSIRYGESDLSVQQNQEGGFAVATVQDEIGCESLLIASGGLSIPSMGSSPFAYRLAEQFGLRVEPVRAGLVPFTLDLQDKNSLADLAGISCRARVSVPGRSFTGDILITHRGLSGPAILQLSSYWKKGAVSIDWLCDIDAIDWLVEAKKSQPKMTVQTLCARRLPSRLVACLLPESLAGMQLANLSQKQIEEVVACLQGFSPTPSGTEGYRTAEVTLGGVSTDELSSKTMGVKSVPGLYFIGECVDVTGWLGGYNFQWAWSSGYVAAQVC